MNLLDKLFTAKGNIRSRLISLVLVAILPVFLFAGSLAAFLTYQQIQKVETGLRATTKALTAAVDRQIVSVMSAVEIIIVTEDFDYDRDILRSLHRRLRRAVKGQEDWTSIGYVDVNGKQYFNTSQPYGVKLPNMKGQEFFDRALETKETSISGYRIGLVSKVDLISIAIPVKVGDKVSHVLTASFRTKAISKILRSQSLPENWTAAVLDKEGMIIARSRSPSKFIGHKSTENLTKLIEEKDESIFQDENKEGESSYGAFSKSQLTGWAVVLGMPYDQVMKSVWETFWIMILGISAFAAVGVIFADVIGRKIANPLLVLSNHARLLGAGEEFPIIDSPITEVTEVSKALKKASIETNLSYEKAQSAIELRDTFLSVASHELKTPVTALQLNLQIIERNLLNSPEGAKHAGLFTRSLSQIKRLTHLIDELLDVSRIASGKVEYRLEEFDLNEMLKDVLAQFPEDRISCELSVQVRGTWDKGRLEQVFTNLISNAIKYGDEKPVSLTMKKVDKTVLVEIRDHGPGIAKEDQKRIFERFERAVNNNSSISGLGLGLWISRQIMVGLKGDIRVESELGQGSTFTVLLSTELS